MVCGSGAGNAQKSVEDRVLTESKVATEVDMGHIKGHRSCLKRLSMAKGKDNLSFNRIQNAVGRCIQYVQIKNIMIINDI